MNRKDHLKWVLSLSLVFFVISLSAQSVLQDPKPKSASEIKLGLEKLNVLGAVLYFAAHPDDENTRLISWLANEKKYRTGYLSLTRGDGGQNLIGLELGVNLGLIRTHEMMAARSHDRGEQFFSAAYDFGFSKTANETFRFWNKEEVLRESVYIIRKFKPDVIINRFPPDARGGHGHHQASAVVAHEAFIAAADPTRFPDQVRELGVWQAKRILWNTANFGGQNNISDDQLKIGIGEFNAILGKSYGEISAVSRSQHKSQGFGAASSRGESFEHFQHVDGTLASDALMDGVDTKWSRLPNTQAIQSLVDQLNRDYQINNPEASIPGLIALYHLVQKVEDLYWKTQKSEEIQELIFACSGIFVEATVPHAEIVQGTAQEVQLDLIVRQAPVRAALKEINGKPGRDILVFNQNLKKTISYTFEDLTQPYWLRRPYSPGKFDVDPAFFGQPVDPDAPYITLVVEVDGLDIPIRCNIQHRFVDPVQGEIHNPVRVIPSFTIQSGTNHILFDQTVEKDLEIEIHRHGGPQKMQVRAHVEGGFKVRPEVLELDFSNEQTIRQTLKIVKNTSASGEEKPGKLTFTHQNMPLSQYQIIRYGHIPAIAWFQPFEIRLQPIDLQVSVQKVAYLSGAGDLIPDALRALGIQVDVVEKEQLQPDLLATYDAVVIGVRAYNVDSELFAKQRVLLEYVENGGVLLVQYQVSGRYAGSAIGPYPFEVTRSRVTEENAEVKFLLPNDPALNYPNLLTARDFEGWVQERGLYFVEKADDRYRKLLAMHDTGEKPHDGALILANHGKGKFVYTSLSLFRQLPAGVPGAYRLLMNLLAKE